MSVRVGLVHLNYPKVEISSQIQQRGLTCQCKVLNVGETALKPALEVVENSKIKRSKGSTHCWFVVQCSVSLLYCSMSRTEDDAVHLARALVHITSKEFIIHNAAFEYPYSAIVMSTHLLNAACNFSLQCTAFASVFGRIHLFLEILHFMINRFAEETSNSSIL